MKRQRKTVRFITRAGCTICDAAYAQLLRAARLRRIVVTTVDIDDDAVLQEEYGGRVPVVLGADGRVLAEGPLTKKDARRAVASARR